MNLNSYENPFVNRDANSDSLEEIVGYWCNPEYVDLKIMLSSNKSIYLVGPRGSGKTTIFKYYTYKAQFLTGKFLSDYIEKQEYVTLYYRMNEYNYASFQGKGLDIAYWRSVFGQMFELKLARSVLDFLYDKANASELSKNGFVEDAFCAYIKNEVEDFQQLNSIESIRNTVRNMIMKISDFVQQRSILDIQYNPFHWYLPLSLVSKIIEAVNYALSKKPFKVSFIVDEFENINLEFQMVINSYVKYLRENITLRIGSRPEGILTFSTSIEQNESLRVGQDYELIELNEYKDIKKYLEFLKNVVNKRLKDVGYEISIDQLLGEKEDIEEEVKRKIPINFKKHFLLLPQTVASEEYELLKNTNKLYELLNIIKFNRNEDINNIHNQMELYTSGKKYQLTKKDQQQYNKYKNSYANKYKKSLAILLLSMANINKEYYSVRTFAYLSSGSVRLFMTLCHKAIEIARYQTNEELKFIIPITQAIQTEATLEVSEIECQYLRGLGTSDDSIYNFIMSMCSLFQSFHTDVELKYPETNQFTVDYEVSIDEVFKLGRRHSFIIRKSTLQQKSIGETKDYIYTINRIVFPSFNLSVVTRGGYNPHIKYELYDKYRRENMKSSKAMSEYLEISCNTKQKREKAINKENKKQIKIEEI